MKAVLLGLLLAGCAPSSQFVLHVDTDAPVPPDPAAPADPLRPHWLFDRLRVEVLRDGAPIYDSAAQRDFGLDERLFTDGAVSFGLAPPVGDGTLSVRVRMFRGDRLLAGEPHPRSTLDTTVRLPPLDAAGRRELTVRLHVDDVGLALGQPDPLDPEEGLPGPSQVGSWPGAQVIPCSDSAGDDEVCVPGGAFWLGDPLITGLMPSIDVDDERLVVLSPYYLDLHEATVAEFRAALPAMLRILADPTPFSWMPVPDFQNFRTWCTWTTGSSADDPTDQHAKLAVNCITWDIAGVYCLVHEKQLPSNSQLEFAASGFGAENAYPWGTDEPTCADAVWGMGGVGYLSFQSSGCRQPEVVGGPTAPGTGRRDRVAVGGRELLDLGGNLAEWTADWSSPQDGAYWQRDGVRTDPVADVMTDDPPTRVLHGGSWYQHPLNVRAAFRDGGVPNLAYSASGVRCARPGR